MTLQEKFAALSPEQIQKFLAVKSEAGLEAFMKEADIELTAEERASVLAYIQSAAGKLSDAELEKTSGGSVDLELQHEKMRQAMEEIRNASNEISIEIKEIGVIVEEKNRLALEMAEKARKDGISKFAVIGE